MDPLYDIAIVGCGPAGISAALNAKIRNKKAKKMIKHVLIISITRVHWFLIACRGESITI